MKIFSQVRTAALAVSLLLSASALSAQELVRYAAQPGSKIRIDGTSTVHDWTVEGQIIGGFLELDPSFDFNNPKPGKVNAKVQATVPARSLRNSKNYKGMDERMHEALKAKEYQKIEYKLTELVLKEAKAGQPLRFDSKGEITVAGVTQTLNMPVTMEKQGDKLKTSGDLTLKMTSFKIDPPAPKVALGLISTGDDVKIRFEWLTAMPQKSASAQ